MSKSTSLYLFMTILLFSACSTKKQHADLILYNAKVYTVDNNFLINDCVVINSGRIIETGKKEDLILKYEAKESENMHGKYIYPGFIDAHCHFYSYSTHRLEADFTGTKSFKEVIEILKNFNEKRKTQWLVGRGWDQNNWTIKEFPDKKALDSAFADIPVFITRVDGHAALANSLALKMAGITKEAKVDGGKILLKDGELTGILIDNAMDIVRNIIPKPSAKINRDALKEAAAKCFGVGLTSLVKAGLDKSIIELIDSMQKSGELRMKYMPCLAPMRKTLKLLCIKENIKLHYSVFVL